MIMETWQQNYIYLYNVGPEHESFTFHCQADGRVVQVWMTRDEVEDLYDELREYFEETA